MLGTAWFYFKLSTPTMEPTSSRGRPGQTPRCSSLVFFFSFFRFAFFSFYFLLLNRGRSQSDREKSVEANVCDMPDTWRRGTAAGRGFDHYILFMGGELNVWCFLYFWTSCKVEFFFPSLPVLETQREVNRVLSKERGNPQLGSCHQSRFIS